MADETGVVLVPELRRPASSRRMSTKTAPPRCDDNSNATARSMTAARDGVVGARRRRLLVVVALLVIGTAAWVVTRLPF